MCLELSFILEGGGGGLDDQVYPIWPTHFSDSISSKVLLFIIKL